MQAPSSSWQWPSSSSSSNQAPKIVHPYLNHTMSMANLQNWRSPPSPSSSTASSTSRSATPTNTTPPSYAKNPWAGSMINLSNLNSPPTSPHDAKIPTPPSSTSRCTTPVAPQAIRPTAPAIAALTTSVQNEARAQAVRVSPTRTTPPRVSPPVEGFSQFATPQTPNPYKQAAVPPLQALIISPNLVADMTRSIPNMLIRLNWERAKAQRFYCWAVPNPKTALLFWMIDDLAAWPRALFFNLEDSMLPFSESDLEGIAADPRKAVQNQWRVMVKELPRAGQHTDFTLKDAIPLNSVGTLRAMSSSSKIVERIRWIGEDDGRTYVRKQFTTSRQSQKSTLFQQLQQFKRLDHSNIAKIVCTYSYKDTFSVITNATQQNLDEYLQMSPDSGRQKEMMGWIFNLVDALAYVHSKDMHHGCIRPKKILIDGNKIIFSSFGFFNSTIVGSVREPDAAQSEEEAYIYAAPELIANRKAGRAADVFSLGCILLTILSVTKGQSVSGFQTYRSNASLDPSFHSNLAQVSSWITRLRTAKGPRGQQKDAAVEMLALNFIEAMLVPDVSKRVKMKRLVKHVAQWNESRVATRRRSLDRIEGMDTTKWSDLGPLDSYYGRRQ